MLKAIEREKLQDCLLLIQSANAILDGISDGVVPKIGQLQKCFEDADETLTALLRA
jgi:hypothetical protein